MFNVDGSRNIDQIRMFLHKLHTIFRDKLFSIFSFCFMPFYVTMLSTLLRGKFSELITNAGYVRSGNATRAFQVLHLTPRFHW